jgi:brefeldin A-resistance guanine nucleotide exchange factor 1
VNVPILLHALSTLPENTLVHAAPSILQGLSLCVQELGSLRSEIMTSPDFWGLLRAVALREDCSQIAFDILEQCASGEPPAIVADNYEAAISVLSSFASALRVVLPQTALNAKKTKAAAASK